MEDLEKEPSFEQSLQELEGIVKTLEEGKIPLEQALALYEKGQKLCIQCGEKLDQAQLKIEHIQQATQNSDRS